MTNQGLDLNVRFDYADLPYGGPVTPAGGVPPLTETVLDDVAGESFGRRYLFRNLLHDAGVVLPPAADQVCEGPETQPTTSC